jgi:DNA-binding transcriptional MerR regulator
MKNNKEEEGLYISFSEVTKLLKVKPHILLYWEKKIPQLKPYRIANRKFYKRNQVNLLLKVKELLDEGYSLEGIRKILKKESLKASTYKVSLEGDLKKLMEAILKELKDIYQKL